jgi:ZIP Zinc transporter.
MRAVATIAIAAGTLLGGAFFHMLPEGIAAVGLQASGFWIAGGFTVFLTMEQFLRWHHSHHASKASQAPAPVTYLVLIGDALHNFLAGLGLLAAVATVLGHTPES